MQLLEKHPPPPFQLILLLLPTLTLAIPTHNLPKPTPSSTVTITTGPPTPSTVPEYVSTPSFTSAILNSTNFFRTAHNATPINYNETLAKFASSFLEDNRACAFHHSGGPFGENLALGYPNVHSGVEAWGNEREEYNFRDPGFEAKTGHFTQLVWKGTTDLGCGRKLCGERGWFLVCEYWPAGNVLGKFDEEVQAAVSAGEKVGGIGWLWGLLVIFWIWVVPYLFRW